MTNALKESLANAVLLLNEALETSQNSDIQIGNEFISREYAEEMKAEFELFLNNEVQMNKKLFKIIPIQLTFEKNNFWRDLQILINEEYIKSL